MVMVVGWWWVEGKREKVRDRGRRRKEGRSSHVSRVFFFKKITADQFTHEQWDAERVSSLEAVERSSKETGRL